FLDYDLVDYTRRLPWQVKLRGGTTKWILKRALKDRLPHDLLSRRKKGFGIPTGRWLRELAPPLAAPGLNTSWLMERWRERAGGRTWRRCSRSTPAWWGNPCWRSAPAAASPISSGKRNSASTAGASSPRARVFTPPPPWPAT